MTEKNKQTIVVIGGGLAGCFLAILLGNRGYNVELYERLSRDDISDDNSKRSYNITFRSYGIEMLQKAGVWNEIKPHLLPLKGASTQLSKNSKPIVSIIKDTNIQYLSISRSDLLTVLINHMVSHPSISMHFETSLLSVDRYEKTLLIQNEKTKTIKNVSCDVLIGADGANSLVRTFMQQGQNTNHAQEYSLGGYKQFTISKDDVQMLNLQNDIAYTWNADQKFILAFPNFNGSLSALLIYPKDKKAFTLLRSENTIKNLLTEDFPFLLPIHEQVTKQFLENPVGGFVTIHTDPWYYKGFITLVGDAAHGFYPFFGQGTTAAFDDCMTLVELIDKYDSDWNKIFPMYQESRKKHMDTLGELSKEGLTRYMRNKRADYESIYSKLESLGHNVFPDYILPPVFQQVMDNPRNTADFVEKHTKQRQLAKKVGISFFILFLTGLVATYEKMQKSTSNKS
jgi:kynurenine 3-monooxygenase